jgi:hypothetical protein
MGPTIPNLCQTWHILTYKVATMHWNDSNPHPPTLLSGRIVMKAQMSSSVDVAGVRDFNEIALCAVRNASCVEGFGNTYS